MERATIDDAEALTRCEEAAYGTALEHVFGDLPWPYDEILARWRTELADPALTTLLTRDGDRVSGFVTFDAEMLIHLGVVPQRWGSGLAGSLHDAALASADGRPMRLWVLEENHRARAFYSRRGWVDDGRTSRSAWTPHPLQVGMSHGGHTARCAHTHLFRGAVVDVDAGPAVPLTSLDRLGIWFADDSYADASVVADGPRALLLAVDPYVTAAGTTVRPGLWVMQDPERTDDLTRLRLGSRVGGDA